MTRTKTPPPIATPSRLDTVTLKKDINTALGAERAAAYWALLPKALMGTATPAEWRTASKGILTTPHEQNLHNSLVLAVLANAHAPASPQSHALLIARSLKRTLSLHAHAGAGAGAAAAATAAPPAAAAAAAPGAAHAAKAKKIARRLNALLTVQALEDQMRVQVLAAKQPNHHRQKMLKQHVPERFLAALPVTADNSVPNQINGGNNIFNDPSLLPTNSTHPLMTPEIQARIQMLQTCRQASALPSTDALKARMHVIAALNSVEIDQECVAFLEQALSSYLKDIITSVQERVRQRQCELAMAAEGHSVHNSNNLMAGGRSMPATPGGTGTGNSNNTQNNHQNNGSNYDAGATDDMDKPETGENGGGSQPHKSEAISLSDLMLSSDITPILLKRSPGSVDTIEQLLANL